MKAGLYYYTVLCFRGQAMSVVSAPASVRNNAGPDLDFEPMPQTTKPPRSVANLETYRSQNSKTEERRRKLTEKGLAYPLETKLVNRNFALTTDG